MHSKLDSCKLCIYIGLQVCILMRSLKNPAASLVSFEWYCKTSTTTLKAILAHCRIASILLTISMHAASSLASSTSNNLRAVCSSSLSLQQRNLFHDLRLRSFLYRCVLSVITAHNLTPEQRDNNYAPPSNPHFCLRNNIQPITGMSPCCGCL